MNRLAIALGVALMLIGAPTALATDNDPGGGHEGVALCHVLGNGYYIYIVVDNDSVPAHLDHGDYLAESREDCPKPPDETETPTNTPTDTPTETTVVDPTATPTTVPQTPTQVPSPDTSDDVVIEDFPQTGTGSSETQIPLGLIMVIAGIGLVAFGRRIR